MKSKQKNRRVRPVHAVSLLVAAAALVLATAGTSFGDPDPNPGAVFTTDSTCTATNQNIYDLRTDVYLDGGPAHTGAAGLADGYYYVQVTDPSGTPVLGSSVTGAVDPTDPDVNDRTVSSSFKTVHVTNGEFDNCYGLWDIVHKGSDLTLQGYDLTTNPGKEYKVWVSDRSDFDGSKTDNFKVNEVVVDPPPPPQATLHADKFYDANANGTLDGGELPIAGWQVNLTGDANNPYLTPHDFTVSAPGTYTVSEGTPTQTNWFHTTDTSVTTSVVKDDVADIEFGNVCVGGGTSALTLGYWSNKNGQNAMTAGDVTMLANLNLVDGGGSAFNPTTKAQVASWLLKATATNMAYMLSAQLATMELNVAHNASLGTRLVYAPGAIGANAAGFITVNALMAEANQSLFTSPLTVQASAARTYQDALKTALDKANNNLNFAQSSPCTFSF